VGREPRWLEILKRVGFKGEDIWTTTDGLPDVDAAGITARTRGANALANIRRGMPFPMKIRDLPIAKILHVPSYSTRRLSLEYADVRLNAQNQIENVELEGIFLDYIKDNNIDRLTYGRQIVEKVWGQPGLPPDIL
jgi:hypothetical protein